MVPPAGFTPLLNIDEGATTRLIETWVEFSMTPQQVEQENRLYTGHQGQDEQHSSSTAVTLATRSANVLCQAEDTVLLQGRIAFPAPAGPSGVPAAAPGSPLFSNSWVLNRETPSDYGLLCVGPVNYNLPATQVVKVNQSAAAAAPAPVEYSQLTVAAIADAYSILQATGHYGPYACVIYFYPYADSYSPLPNTLILPADRINPLMTKGYYGTGTMPGIPNPTNPPAAGPLAAIPNPTNLGTQSMGLVVSIGGNTMDLVIGQDPVTAFMQQDPNGNVRFRVVERFALRLKDMSAVIRLEFQ